MVIKTESPIVTEKKENKHYEINYGVLKRGSNTKVNFNFSETSFLNSTKSCGCTTPTVTPTEKGFNVEIVYDSNKIGTINQYAKITTTEGEVKIDLKGQII